MCYCTVAAWLAGEPKPINSTIWSIFSVSQIVHSLLIELNTLNQLIGDWRLIDLVTFVPSETTNSMKWHTLYRNSMKAAELHSKCYSELNTMTHERFYTELHLCFRTASRRHRSKIVLFRREGPSLNSILTKIDHHFNASLKTEIARLSQLIK